MDTRTSMNKYWEEHSRTTTLEEMFLDDNAEKINLYDSKEIFDILPSLTGKKVAEIGAGIGRLTQFLAAKCKSVRAIDFMKTFIEKNEKDNSKFGNVTFECGDATVITADNNSYDFVFTNWLLMYLSDDECEGFVRKVLGWLNLGGYLFIRESCLFQSGDKPRSFNPTFYRSPDYYFNLLNNVSVEEFSYQLIKHDHMKCYEELKGNVNQVYWLFQKIETVNKPRDLTLQNFLDNQQYALNGILTYEKIFGHGFISTGGATTTTRFLKTLNLKPGQQVLDVGCGIGGGDFLMAKEYGVTVHGIDLSTNMLNLALERAKENEALNVMFNIANVMEVDYANESFDLIYSRDAILHIADKKGLFERFFKWLKPGGQLFITDYCCGEQKHTEAFIAYVKQRDYKLLSPEQYSRLLESVGFTRIRGIDNTKEFMECCETEKEVFVKNHDTFVAEYSEEDYLHLLEGWTSKLIRCGDGDQKWGLFHFIKTN